MNKAVVRTVVGHVDRNVIIGIAFLYVAARVPNKHDEAPESGVATVQRNLPLFNNFNNRSSRPIVGSSEYSKSLQPRQHSKDAAAHLCSRDPGNAPCESRDLDMELAANQSKGGGSDAGSPGAVQLNATATAPGDFRLNPVVRFQLPSGGGVGSEKRH